MFRTIAGNWKKIFSHSSAGYILILTVVLLVAVLNRFEKFLFFIEARKGVVLEDPLFNLYAARDFNTPIFIIIYGSLLTGVIALMQHPRYLMLAMQTFILMVLFRFVAMYLVPLEVPYGCINLRDPLVFTLGTGRVITKDLFFSGHIASLTILFLTARNNYLKYIFLALTIILAMLILLQKNHYTIDVYASPFFVFAAWSIAKNADEKIFKRSL